MRNIAGSGPIGSEEVSSMENLSPSKINDYLKTKSLGQKMIIFATVDSTNSEGKRRSADEAEGTVLLSEVQTAGRGRLGRHWFSPGGKGIWLSVILKPELPAPKVPSLTSVAAAAVCLALEQVLPSQAERIQLKWPNDILLNGRKIGGILTEMQVSSAKVQAVILGIGLNVNLQPEDFPEEIRDLASSIYLETGQILAREQIIAFILNHLEQLYFKFLQQDLSETLAVCRRKSAVLGRKIFLIDRSERSVNNKKLADNEKLPNSGELTGSANPSGQTLGGQIREAEAVDLGPNGELLVRYENGEEAFIISGEISLRMQ